MPQGLGLDAGRDTRGRGEPTERHTLSITDEPSWHVPRRGNCPILGDGACRAEISELAHP